MRFIAICALLGALLGSGVAYTQVVPANSGQPLRAKYLAKFEAQFSTADKDGDGALTKAEADAGGLGRIVENFDRIDTNKDGKVTREEIRAMLRSRVSS
jgi:Ca2+-binding EF-hand superfamily protein